MKNPHYAKITISLKMDGNKRNRKKVTDQLAADLSEMLKERSWNHTGKGKVEIEWVAHVNHDVK